MRRPLRWSIAFLAASPVLLAQAPTIRYVYPDNGAQFSPGVRIRIFGTHFDPAAGVRMSGRDAPVLDRQPWIDDNDVLVGDILFTQVPIELAPGPATVVVTSAGATSPGFDLVLDPYSPVFERRTYERAVLGDGPDAGYVCSPNAGGGTPKAGEIVRAYLDGLGATDPPVPAGLSAPASPLAHTVVTPVITVGGQNAEVVESVLSPGEIGVYRVSFKVPPGDGDQPVAAGIGGFVAAGLDLPVGNAVIHFLDRTAAPQSYAAAFACGGSLTTAVPPGTSLVVASGDPRNPPVELAGTTVKLKDSNGVERLAQLLDVSPSRVNYIVPAGTSPGTASVTIAAGDGAVSIGTIQIVAVRPRLFPDVYSGFSINPFQSRLAGVVMRLRDGVQTFEPFATVDAAGRSQPVPIDMGPETDEVYLLLFGTGWRLRSSLANVRMQFGRAPGPLTLDGEVEYAGAQNEFVGMDQMNVKLPRSLAGLGQVLTNISVDGDDREWLGLVFK